MRRLFIVFLTFLAVTASAQTNPVPYIAEPLSPTTLPPGSQGFVLTVHGGNFAPTAVLQWNGKQRETIVVSSTLLQATIKTSDLTQAGSGQVTVVNLGSNNPVSNTAFFTIRKPSPDVALTAEPDFSGSGAYSVVGDFNNDGKLDVATCTPKGGAVINVYLGAGHGKFQRPIKSAFIGRVSPGALFVGDFNGDHKLDLLVASESRVSVLIGDGTGKFTEGPITSGQGETETVFEVADINGDGILDLLLTGGYRNQGNFVAVWLGKGDGSFSVGSTIQLGAPLTAVLGDFNEDGNLDLAVVDYKAGVDVALNQGKESFLPMSPIRCRLTPRL